MGNSVYQGMIRYLKDVWVGARSILGSCMTAAPYLLRWGELRKEVTEGYPDPVSSKTADDLPSRSRGLLFNDIDQCTGCGNCVRICPSQSISLKDEPGSEASKRWISVYDIDFSRCVFCGLCVEVCEPGSLFHTKQYEGAAYQLSDLIASFGRGELSSEQKEKWALLRDMDENNKGLS